MFSVLKFNLDLDKNLHNLGPINKCYFNKDRNIIIETTNFDFHNHHN